MNQNEIKDKNSKKRGLIIALIITISVSLLVIISAVIYNHFFEKNVQKEEQKKVISESFDKQLKEMEEQIKVYQEESKKIIDKHSLDICGKYVNVYNEIAQSESDSEQADLNATQTVTTVMMINKDNTIDFADGKVGWWSLYETEEGIVHMGYGIEGAQNMGMFMVCEGNLIDVTSSAVLFGKLPPEDTFDGEFTDGNLTFTFKQDGTLEAEYTENVTEEGITFPYTEMYRGEYHRDGMYMDILLNGSTSRYITFNLKTKDPAKPVSGIAAKYFVKADV